MSKNSLQVFTASLTLAGAASAQIRFTEDHRVVPTGVFGARGCVSADFDGDGDDDVLLGASERNASGTLLINQGDRFVRASGCSSSSSWFDHARTGDIDGDGDVDFIGQAGIELNQGAGCFSGPAFGPRGRSLALGDIDGDGDLDVAAGFPTPYCDHSYIPCVDAFVFLWRNDGASGFVDISAQLPPNIAEEPVGMVLADLDGDGDLDLYIAAGYGEDGWGTHKLLLNDGSGSFSDASSQLPTLALPLVSGSSSTHAADFDGDSDLDLLVGSEQLYLNLGGAVFANASASLPDAGPSAVGDLDGDGDLDIVAGGLKLENDGAAAFTTSALPITGFISDSVLSDYDGDGDLDVFAVTAAVGEILFNDGAGTFTALVPRVPDLGDYTRSVASGDVDGDHDIDVFLGTALQDRLYLNDGASNFVVAQNQLGAHTQGSNAVELADLDGDGDLDAVVARSFEPLRVLLNDGSGAFSTQPPVGATQSIRALAVGDVDLDGDLDVLSGNGTQSNTIYGNDGLGNLSVVPGSWPQGHGGFFVEFADPDGDGDLDAFTGDGSLRAFRNDGTGSFALDLTLLNSASAIERCAFGDLDGDGDQDLVGIASYALFTATNLGGFFGAGTYQYSVGNGDAVELADFDLDGDVDVVLGFPLEIFENDGAGNLARASTSLPWLAYSADLLAEDFDDDGDRDLLLARPGRSILLSNLARHCAWRTPPRIGSTLQLALHGPQNAEYLLLAAHAQAYVPLGTLGVLRVNRSTLELRRHGVLDAQGRAIEPYVIANDPLLAGTSLYWQALIANPRKLTNLEITTFTGL